MTKETFKSEIIVPKTDNSWLNSEPNLIETKKLKSYEISDFITDQKNTWMQFYKKTVAFKSYVLKAFYDESGYIVLRYLDNHLKRIPFVKKLYLDVVDKSFFKDFRKEQLYVCESQMNQELVKMEFSEKDRNSDSLVRFFEHFSITRIFNDVKPIYQILSDYEAEPEPLDVVLISSFNFQKRPVFCITTNETKFIYEINHPYVVNHL